MTDSRAALYSRHCEERQRRGNLNSKKQAMAVRLHTHLDNTDRRQQMNLRKVFILICFLVLAGIFLWTTLGRNVPNVSQEQPTIQFEYETLFTTGLNKNDRPVDRAEEISMEQERIYFYITWRNLSNKKYNLKTMIYDGNGKHVFSVLVQF